MVTTARSASASSGSRSSATSLNETICMDVYSMARKSKKRTHLRFDGISQSSLDVKDYRIVTEFYVKGYGSVPIIRGDPRILPPKARLFVAEKAKLMRPRAIYICDGSQMERMELMEKITKRGVAQPLSALVGCHLVSTDPLDAGPMQRRPVVSVPKREIIETKYKNGRLRFNKWMSPFVLDLELDERFPGAMIGRVMYVVPFSLGPIGAPNSLNCIQLTDSAYVALMTGICARVSASVWDSMEQDNIVRCVHTVGMCRPAHHDIHSDWPCVPDRRFIALNPDNREVWSYGSGNKAALVCKGEVALRLASIVGKERGWLAERMTIIAVTAPDKAQYFIGVAGPEGCGKTCLALMQPTLSGWKVEVIGDEVAWLRVGKDGKLYASNPLNGFYLNASRFNPSKSSVGKDLVSKNALFTNVGHTSHGRPCWSYSGVPCPPGEVAYDWRGKAWNGDAKTMIEHPEATVAMRYADCSAMHPEWKSSEGVPLSAVVFCVRRYQGVPLVYESYSWQNGVFQAATLRSESPDPAKGKELHFDPMGMAEYVGYSFGDYIRHWLSFSNDANRLPRLFFANLYQRDAQENYLWPGFGDNIRILAWIIKRITSTPEDGAVKAYIGYVPDKGSIDITGLDVKWEELMEVSKDFWAAETRAMKKIFDGIFGAHIPKAMVDEFFDMNKRIATMNRSVSTDSVPTA